MKGFTTTFINSKKGKLTAGAAISLIVALLIGSTSLGDLIFQQKDYLRDGFFVDKNFLSLKENSPVSSVPKSIPIMNCDVVVVGGGAGGTAAAIQSARSGADTCLIEEGDWLGGMLTSAGVSSLDGNDWNYTGILQEFIERIKVEYKDHPEENRQCFAPFCFEPSVGDKVFKEMVEEEANLVVFYNTKLEQVVKNNNRIEGVVTTNDLNQVIFFQAKVTIEATELGDLLYLGEVPFDLGIDQGTDEPHGDFIDQCMQPITMVAILEKLDHEVPPIPKPAGYKPETYKCFMPNASCPDSTTEFRDWNFFLGYGNFPFNKTMVNVPSHSYGNDFRVDQSDFDPNTRAEILAKAREFTLGLVYYIQTELGKSNYTLANEFGTEHGLAKKPYVRESRRVKGVSRITEWDVIPDKKTNETKFWADSIAVGDYPLDIHSCRHGGPAEFIFLPPFQVPYSALIPQEIDGLIVAEKSISVSHIANGRTRLQPIVMSISQAAGAAAAIAAREDIEPRDINITELQKTLVAAKSRINFFYDLEPHHWAFEPVSILRQQQVINGYGENYFHGSKSITRAEFATIIARSFGESTDSLANAGVTFKDMEGENHWYQQYALNLPQSLVTKYGFKDFSANEPITRAEAARWLYEHLDLRDNANLKATKNVQFSDSSNKDLHYPALKKLAESEILSVYKGKISPDAELSRVAAATIIYRLQQMGNN